MILKGISHYSLRSPNRVCNIGWAENGPGAVLCTLTQPFEITFHFSFVSLSPFYGMLMNI